MEFRKRLMEFLEPEPMLHRPPLSPRFWIYASSAYLMPVVVQVVFPEDPTLTDELIWLVTLAPGFLLALHYGLRGAFAALLMGTALFIVVQSSSPSTSRRTTGGSRRRSICRTASLRSASDGSQSNSTPTTSARSTASRWRRSVNWPLR